MESQGTPSSGQPATRILNAPAELGRGVVLSNRYEVDRVLGQGGMGVVVAALDRATGRRVALKFLQIDAARDPETHARFLREAQAASAIACEHVVTVFEAGMLASGSPYIVMELLEGEDLAQAVERQGPLPLVDVVDHVLEALVAIGLAHLRGIVHRDLKPANLFLTRTADGRPLVKVLDFGLSKDAAGREGLNLTKTSHAAVGTPLYMAPEQIRSLKSASFASDLWAMGVILFELATAQLPFDGESLGALFSSIAADPPRRLDQLLPGAPGALVDAIDRCLRKKPGDRPADALTLAQLLVPLASVRGRAAFERLQREHAAVTGGWNLAGGAIVDEPSGARAPVAIDPGAPTAVSTGGARLPATFAMTAGPAAVGGRAMPATFAMTAGMPLPDPTRVSPGGEAEPPTIGRSRRGPGNMALILAACVAAAGLGGGAWWFTTRQAVEGPGPAATRDGAPPAVTALPAPTVTPVGAAPEGAPPSTVTSTVPAVSAAPPPEPPPPAPATSPAVPPPASPRPPRPPPTGATPSPTADPAPPSTSLEDVMKRGRR